MSDQKEYRAGRVIQLDASVLDESLIKAFETHLDEIFDSLLQRNIALQIQYNRCKKFISMFYYLPQIIFGRSTAQHLMNIHFYKMSRIAAFIRYFVDVLTPCTLNVVAETTSNRKTQKFAEMFIASLSLLHFVHFFYFLNNSGQKSFSERLLNLRPSYMSQPTFGKIPCYYGMELLLWITLFLKNKKIYFGQCLGLINYDGLNRELSGHCFGHLCVFLAPLIQFTLFKLKQNAIKSFEKEQLDFEKPVICTKCNCVATIPIKAQHKDANIHLMCYYCYNLDQHSYVDMMYLDANFNKT